MSSKPSNPPPPRTTAQATLAGIGNLIKLLPTGTVFAFQFLNPVFTNDGQCHPIHKYLASFLIAACGASCCFASFTDSYTDNEGNVHYGVATTKGLWPSPSPSSAPDLSSYKLRFGDFVHAFFSLVVFSVVSLLDPNTVKCFYPSFESAQKALLMAMPPVIGAISGAVFVMFPNTRHGIGYPCSQASSQA
ncbi:protein DMP2-like [Salvia miltiorrhiza]|uniref:protein DMP2-like n=1 Tax=Salvia miltiorrhiza TaxID=226208 RepID=UPI0025AB87DE|nr:protein DMP2-like [Salvia miltiorrhiza]